MWKETTVHWFYFASQKSSARNCINRREIFVREIAGGLKAEIWSWLREKRLSQWCWWRLSSPARGTVSIVWHFSNFWRPVLHCLVVNRKSLKSFEKPGNFYPETQCYVTEGLNFGKNNYVRMCKNSTNITCKNNKLFNTQQNCTQSGTVLQWT